MICAGLTMPGMGSAAAALSFSTATMAEKHARVLVVQDPAAMQAFKPKPEVVETMVRRGLFGWTGKTNYSDAWSSLISMRDIVGIKVYCAQGALGGTRPEVVAAVVKSLLAAGLPPEQIIIWDKDRTDLSQAGYMALGQRFGVRVKASQDTGYDDTTFYESSFLGRLVYGDHEFGRKGEGMGRKSFVSNLVTKEMTKIISVTPMSNHYRAGVTGNLYSLAQGSVDNFLRFEHYPDRMVESLPEIIALPILGDRVVLNIVDGLICQYEGEQMGLLHYAFPLCELRFSIDPVALDVLSIKEIQHQRHVAGHPEMPANLDLYKVASWLEIGFYDSYQIRLESAP